MPALLLALLLCSPADTSAWVERIQKDPAQSRELCRAADAATIEAVVTAVLDAKDAASLDALGWEAVAALPADSEPAQRLLAHVLTSGVRAMAHAPEGYEVVLGAVPAMEPDTLSLVWESGSGHGFTLARYRARWSEDGLCVRRLRYFGNIRTDRKEGVIAESAVIPRRRAEVVLRVVLAASALGLKQSSTRLGGFSSSRDFHVLLDIRGEEPVVEKHFTGYVGSSRAPRYVGLLACNALLNEALDTCTWKPETPTDDDLADLAQRLSTLEAESWWVRERLILMAGAVGDKRCLPALEAQIRRELDSTMRAHKYAIDAYARISGIDLRPAEFSTAEVPATREKYVAHFDKK